MSVSDELDNLRTAFAGCQMVAFADIGAQIVLVSSSEATARRDTLDELCAQASSLFSTAEVPEIAGDSDADLALQAGGGPLRIFLRSPTEKTDALCAICEPSMDIAGYVNAARAALTRLSGPAA